MKSMSVLALLSLAVIVPGADAVVEGSPVSKVFEMLADLQAKIIKEGTEAQKTYDEFTEWCEDRSTNIGFEIKTGKAEVEDLKAAIEKADSQITALSTKIEEISESTAKDEADLKAAGEIRAQEAADFAAEEKESKDIISTLGRAIAVLNREMAKSPAAMLQFKNGGLVKAFSAMVQASMLSSSDASRLTMLLQNKQNAEDSDSDAEAGAPDPAAYKGKSDGIIGTLEDLLEKAEMQLETARKTEETNLHNYEMLKQSLDAAIADAAAEMADAKKGLSTNEEAKSTAEGDLSVTTADLKEDVATLQTLHQDCMKGAEEFQLETKSRGEELSALATAKKILAEALPAAAQTYSFVQLSRTQLSSSADLAKFEAVRFIRDLARKQNSNALAQLASRMSSAIRMGESSGADPFAKVKSLITDMIATLEKDAQGEATQKAYCDKETAETKEKKLEKEHEINKLSTKIDSMTAKSAKLKEEVAELQKELAAMAASQREMDKIRSEEKALYEKNSAEMKAGIEGVKKALSVLKEYYAKADKGHSDKGDAAGGIVSMLEVVESDFTKGLADMESVESSAAAEYEKTSTENKFAKVSKDKDVKYKAKESAGLDKASTEAVSDREGIQAELDALNEYLEKLNGMCIAKAEPYAEKKARREAEIAGLKQALEILDGEAALIQETAKHALRGKK